MPKKTNLPKRMFKSVVCCTRVDEITTSKFFYVSQSLKLRRINNCYTKSRKFHVIVNGVVENL